MDLLGPILCKGGNAGTPHCRRTGQNAQSDAPTMLLARLPAPLESPTHAKLSFAPAKSFHISTPGGEASPRCRHAKRQETAAKSQARNRTSFGDAVRCSIRLPDLWISAGFSRLSSAPAVVFCAVGAFPVFWRFAAARRWRRYLPGSVPGRTRKPLYPA